MPAPDRWIDIDTDEVTEAQAISDALGLRVAVCLCAAYGGKTLYVPSSPSASHPIALDIGLEQLTALCDLFGGQTIHLPKLDSARLARERRKAIRLKGIGLEPREIADILDVSHGTVLRWLRSSRGREGTL